MFLDRRCRLILAAFLVSLTINLVMGGMALGHRLQRGPDRWAQHGVERLTADLPPRSRDLFRDAFERHRAGLDEAVKHLRTTRAEALRLLQAPEFDRQALDSLLTQLRGETGEVQAIVQQSVVEAAAAMPAGDRERWQPHFLAGR